MSALMDELFSLMVKSISMLSDLRKQIKESIKSLFEGFEKEFTGSYESLIDQMQCLSKESSEVVMLRFQSQLGKKLQNLKAFTMLVTNFEFNPHFEGIVVNQQLSLPAVIQEKLIINDNVTTNDNVITNEKVPKIKKNHPKNTYDNIEIPLDSMVFEYNQLVISSGSSSGKQVRPIQKQAKKQWKCDYAKCVKEYTHRASLRRHEILWHGRVFVAENRELKKVRRE